jgi:hypothetical protein
VAFNLTRNVSFLVAELLTPSISKRFEFFPQDESAPDVLTFFTDFQALPIFCSSVPLANTVQNLKYQSGAYEPKASKAVKAKDTKRHKRLKRREKLNSYKVKR